MTNKVIYLIGSLKNRKIIDLAIRIREACPDVEVFDEWIVPGEEADDKFDEYRKKRGLNYAQTLKTRAARQIYEFDKANIDRADTVIMVMPAGKSAHAEMGYSSGQGKKVYILMDKEPERIDVMHQFATDVFMTEEELMEKLLEV